MNGGGLLASFAQFPVVGGGKCAKVPDLPRGVSSFAQFPVVSGGKCAKVPLFGGIARCPLPLPPRLAASRPATLVVGDGAAVRLDRPAFVDPGLDAPGHRACLVTGGAERLGGHDRPDAQPAVEDHGLVAGNTLGL